MNILVTGADGFVGSSLCKYLSSKGLTVRGALWKQTEKSISCHETEVIGNIDGDTNWKKALENIDIIVHCAARVHVMKDSSDDPLNEFRKTNVDGTLNLASQAAAEGIKKIIFISSIKVNGEFTHKEKPFRHDDSPAPVDPYGISKLEAEECLKKISKTSDLNYTIIRPTLIYGPGVKANFLNMMKWLYKGMPLPFGKINNMRSLLALDNLTDFIYCCAINSKSDNKTFLISDDNDLSTTELMKKTSALLNKRSKLLPIPEKVIQCLAKIVGKEDFAQRLLGSLQVDISFAKETLNWTPVISFDEALEQTTKDFLKGCHK
ncbi:MAG: NAD-dependent epimerase/dehydratase family protein [Gammaproteobacteria bacterium]|nr:MAG: NAD-dependent epimerase/dehydratase family protein [Gammaproteobacteria bacterium]